MKRWLLLLLLFCISQPQIDSVVDCHPGFDTCHSRESGNPALATHSRIPSQAPDDKNDNSNDVISSLESVQQLRRGRWHLQTLTEELDPIEEQVVEAIEKLFEQSYQERQFNDQEETWRMMAIDYLGERVQSRIPARFLSRIKKILEDHHRQIERLSESNFEKRQWQSFKGDQEDISTYFNRHQFY